MTTLAQLSNENAFNGKYKISQTLKFELKPIGATLENLEKSDLLKHDFERSKAYAEIKQCLDQQHKAFLEATFENITDISWQKLADAIQTFKSNQKNSQQDNDSEKLLEKCYEEYRKIIASSFKANKTQYDLVVGEATPSKLIKKLCDEAGTDVPAAIKSFEKFATYFKGYQENRKNIYSGEAQNTSAAFRAVNDNFTKFYQVSSNFASLQGYDELLQAINARTEEIRMGASLTDLLSIANYNKYLSQKGIEYINSIIAEINYCVNQFRQQHKEISPKQLPFLPVLFKQILSNREGRFTVASFADDTSLCDALKQFIASKSNANIYGECADCFDSIHGLFLELNEESELYVTASELTRISSVLTEDWETINLAKEKWAENNLRTKALREKYIKQSVYSFGDIKKWNIEYHDKHEKSIPVVITDYWHCEYAENLFRNEKAMRRQIQDILAKSDSLPLRERHDDVEIIKDYLDAVQEILHMLKPLNVGLEYDGDANLQQKISDHYDMLADIIPLYNMTRNYITRKLTDESQKIKLTFDNVTLADGWDVNKEAGNKAIIMLKGEQYFLGIIAGKKIDFSKLACEGSDNCYRKMIYKLLPGPNKMLPHVFFSKKNIDYFKPSAELLSRYRNGDYKKGASFDLAFCHELIDFFKASIARHDDWSKFGFKFSDTASYRGIDEFYNEISEQGYAISFANIPAETVDQLVADGKLYLFQIWNKDFAENSKGRSNKSTLYWKAIFDEKNLEDVVFKLNGEAELFLREPVIKDATPTHAKGSKVVNKTIVTGINPETDIAERTPLPEKIHNEIYKYVNGYLKEKLSDEAEHYLANRLDWKPGMTIRDTIGKIVVKEVNFDLTKDKRYTQRKLFFHVPYTINFKAPASYNAKVFNEQVQDFLRCNPDVNIIGIDRGERHLIYLSMIDRSGRAKIHRSFNILNGVDYNAKLAQRAAGRQEARKSWQEIGSIKDLKAGYLSGVVREIVNLMVEHNAILIMEDLNAGFKRGRSKFEKQVYQKFEKMLIDKLSYLTFKDIQDPKAKGGIMNGYQLANKFDSFSKMGKQNGFMFYVPAAYTSKIDPTTGFTNLFKLKECTNTENRRTFLETFDAIKYDKKRNAFAFSFNYSNFKTSAEDWQKAWTVYSAQERLVYISRSKTTEKKFPTNEILTALQGRGVTVDDGFDLKAYLQTVSNDKDGDSFVAAVFYAFTATLQMRNSMSGNNDDNDYIESPVLNENGDFYSSLNKVENLPCNADDNGAFHIALKGLYLLTEVIDKQIPEAKDAGKFYISNSDWLKFVQSRSK